MTVQNISYDIRGLSWPKSVKDYWIEQGGCIRRAAEPTVVQVLVSLIVANKPSLVVESGIAHGTTALWLAMTCRDLGLQYVGIDSDDYACVTTKAVLQKHGLTDATVLPGSSPDAIPDGVGLLFLDDWHDPQHVLEEVAAVWPKMAPGGLICFHDVLGDFGINERLAGTRMQRIVNKLYTTEQAPMGGLGILVKE